jgi:hypothetical protein
MFPYYQPIPSPSTTPATPTSRVAFSAENPFHRAGNPSTAAPSDTPISRHEFLVKLAFMKEKLACLYHNAANLVELQQLVVAGDWDEIQVEAMAILGKKVK